MAQPVDAALRALLSSLGAASAEKPEDFDGHMDVDAAASHVADAYAMCALTMAYETLQGAPANSALIEAMDQLKAQLHLLTNVDRVESSLPCLAARFSNL